MKYTINTQSFNTKKEIKTELFRVYNSVSTHLDQYSSEKVEVKNEKDFNFIKELISYVLKDEEVTSFSIFKAKFGLGAVINNKYKMKLQRAITAIPVTKKK